MAVGVLSRGGAAQVPDFYPAPGVDTIGVLIRDKVPAIGGVVRIGQGYYDETPDLCTFLQRENIRIEGIGGPTGGADTGSVIRFNQAGANGTHLFDWADQTGCGISNLEVLSTNPAFYGDVISTAGSTVQAMNPYIRDCLIAAQAQGIFTINGATNAAPIVIATTAPHGWATGEFVRVAGVAGNTAANGELWRITVVDATHFSLDFSTGNGAYTAGGNCSNYNRTCTLLNTDRSIEGEVRFSHFLRGGVAIKGLPLGQLIVDATNATPIVIATAAAHGYATNDTVRVAGVAGNTAANNQWTITVVDATHFSLNGSVGNGAFVASNAYANQGSPKHFSNVWNLVSLETRRQVMTPLLNAGDSWKLDSHNGQGKDAPGALADIGLYAHTPGAWARNLVIVGDSVYDQTTTNQGIWLRFAGNGCTIQGGKYSGRQVSLATFLKVDEDGSTGILGLGPSFDNMYIELDLGAITGSNGLWIPGGRTNTVAGWKSVQSTAVRKGKEFIDTGASVGRASWFLWDDTITAMADQYDGDTLVRWYKIAAGVMYTPAEVRAAGRLTAGYLGTAGTQLWGTASEAIAGISAVGSNANIDSWVDPKGTGKVRLNPNAPTTTGGVELMGKVILGSSTTPPQVTANQNDYTPTNWAVSARVRLDLSAAWAFSGFGAGVQGEIKVLVNTSAFSATIQHLNAGSAAANRVRCPNAVDLVVRQQGAVILQYDTVVSNWLVIAAAA